MSANAMSMPLHLVARRGDAGYVSWYDMTAAQWQDWRGKTVSTTITMTDSRVPRERERRRADDDPASVLGRRLRELAGDAERYATDPDRESWMRCLAVELHTIADELWAANAWVANAPSAR